MGSETPIRNQFGTIIGMQPKGETDPVQDVLDASMQAVGAMPEVQPPVTTPAKRPLPPLPSFRLEIVAAVVCLALIGLAFLPKRTTAPPQGSIPPTVAPSATPQLTVTPTIPANPRAVTLAAVTLYGDYDEETRIGQAPNGIACTLSGQSPDGNWAYLACPAPTGQVWAKVGDLGLSAEQRSVLRDTRIVSRSVPTALAFSSSTPQEAGPALAFCADRSSIWGNTHQCSSSQAAAEALADSEMRAINATAVAINHSSKP